MPELQPFQLFKISLVTSTVTPSVNNPGYWQFLISELLKLNIIAVHSEKGSNHLAEHEKREDMSLFLLIKFFHFFYSFSFLASVV
jgi:hypothetical protein